MDLGRGKVKLSQHAHLELVEQEPDKQVLEEVGVGVEEIFGDCPFPMKDPLVPLANDKFEELGILYGAYQCRLSV